MGKKKTIENCIIKINKRKNLTKVALTVPNKETFKKNPILLREENLFEKQSKETNKQRWHKSNGQHFLGRYKERYCATVTHQHVLYLFDLAPL